MEPKLRNQLVRLSNVIEVVEEARIKRHPTKHQDFKWFEKTVMKKEVRQGGEGDGDLRIDDSFFDPPGKLLCETRPPTIYDIVRYRNFLEKRENDKTDSALLKVIVPKLIAIWKKVHPSLILRTEKAISNHLIQIIDKYNQCKLKRSKNDAMNLIAGAHQVFNCSTCKCAMAEVWLACAEKSCRKIPPHTHVRCECENSNEVRKFNSFKKSSYQVQNLYMKGEVMLIPALGLFLTTNKATNSIVLLLYLAQFLAHSKGLDTLSFSPLRCILGTGERFLCKFKSCAL